MPHSIPYPHQILTISIPAKRIWNDRLSQSTMLLLKAEKKCRRLKMGNIEFSSTLQLQRNLLRFWKLTLEWKQGKKVDSKYLARWEKKLNLKYTFNTPTQIIQSHIKDAFNRYQALKKEHSALRDEWIEQLAAAKAEVGNANSVTFLKQLRQREKWEGHTDKLDGLYIMKI